MTIKARTALQIISRIHVITHTSSALSCLPLTMWTHPPPTPQNQTAFLPSDAQPAETTHFPTQTENISKLVLVIVKSFYFLRQFILFDEAGVLALFLQI